MKCICKTNDILVCHQNSVAEMDGGHGSQHECTSATDLYT